jgi:hypothetical protein
MTQEEMTTMHDAWELVAVTPEQASAIFDKLGEMFTEAPEVKQAFEAASVAVLVPEPPVEPLTEGE